MPEKVVEAGVVAYNIEAYNQNALNFILRNKFAAPKSKSKSKSKRHIYDLNEIEKCDWAYCY